ncbi:hypothetical protein ACFWYW_56630 [Nonomuraea sp. NPDC059023]|uniref:hypothetical protein n=1 Tax=unclassified Nonomuraea TaxID=2593643 RepID=UPI003699E905
MLDVLLEQALRPGAAATDPDFAAVRLGALFQLAFDGGLLRLPTPGHDPGSSPGAGAG